LSALCCTAELSSSIEAAVCCNALACSSVRDDRSTLPAAICVLAMATLSAFSRTSVTMPVSVSLMRFIVAMTLTSSPGSHLNHGVQATGGHGLGHLPDFVRFGAQGLPDAAGDPEAQQRGQAQGQQHGADGHGAHLVVAGLGHVVLGLRHVDLQLEQGRQAVAHRCVQGRQLVVQDATRALMVTILQRRLDRAQAACDELSAHLGELVGQTLLFRRQVGRGVAGPRAGDGGDVLIDLRHTLNGARGIGVDQRLLQQHLIAQGQALDLCQLRGRYGAVFVDRLERRVDLTHAPDSDAAHQDEKQAQGTGEQEQPGRDLERRADRSW
jgi:hypothetical protein